jgi:DNA-binding LacI/PurR family transcriptional regulator
MADGAKTRATIFDVAEAAGVSITTVSHVFSGKRRVNEDTRRRVLDAAERLAYRPRPSARALAAGRTNTLALSIPFTGPDLLLNAFFNELLRALSIAALDLGFSFLYVPPDASAELSAPLLDGRVDGVVLVTPGERDPFVEAVVESGVPHVRVGTLREGDGGPWVGADAGALHADVLEHLRERGYGRPALLSLALKVAPIVVHERAFRELAGPRAAVVDCAHTSERDGYEAALEALSAEAGRPDSLVCIGSGLAVGALRACLDLDLAVPDEIGIVCVGDAAEATHVRPELTAVDLHAAAHAERAIEFLAASFAGGSPAVPIVIETRLIPRGSTAR